MILFLSGGPVFAHIAFPARAHIAPSGRAAGLRPALCFFDVFEQPFLFSVVNEQKNADPYKHEHHCHRHVGVEDDVRNNTENDQHNPENSPLCVFFFEDPLLIFNDLLGLAVKIQRLFLEKLPRLHVSVRDQKACYRCRDKYEEQSYAKRFKLSGKPAAAQAAQQNRAAHGCDAEQDAK